MSLSTTRSLFDKTKRNKFEDDLSRYQDYLKNTLIGDLKWTAIMDNSLVVRGWLQCDGSSISRTTYSDLFAVIGTTYGSADDAHFNLPDCKGRVLAAPGKPYDTAPSTLALGNSFGYQNHTLSVNEMPSHTHQHNGTGPLGSGQDGYGLAYQDGHSTINSGTNDGAEPNLYTQVRALNINTTGGSQPFDIQQPTIVIGNVYIYSGVYEQCMDMDDA